MTRKSAAVLLPEIGDIRKIRPRGFRGYQCSGKVVEVNKTGLWYRVQFDYDGKIFTECFSCVGPRGFA